MVLKYSFKRIIAIFRKQKKELLRNNKMLLIFLVFPISMFLFSLINQEISESLFLFIMMGCVMPPMTSIASQIAEEHETGTLKGIIFAGVKSYEYLIGMMLFTGMIAVICVCIMEIILENKASSELSAGVIIISFLAIACSMIIGAAVGIASKNQVSVSAVIVPTSLIILFSSIIGMANHNVHNFTRFLYSQVLLDLLIKNKCSYQDIFIILGNLVIIITIFVLLYMRKRKEE